MKRTIYYRYKDLQLEKYVQCSFIFCTDTFRDAPNNYFNVISDFLTELWGAGNWKNLSIIKVGEKKI